MTAGLWWRCQEAGVLSIHQLPPQVEASSVEAAEFLSIHRFQQNVFPELQPGPLRALVDLDPPLPRACSIFERGSGKPTYLVPDKWAWSHMLILM